jgi:F-type H+-transporting ATPase subunit b
MAHSEPAKSSGSPILNIVAGAVLMVVGMIVNRQVGRVEPMGIAIEPGITLATIGVLLILFPVIKIFFVNPLEAALHERNSNLEETFGEAEALRTEMQSLRTSYEARLAETEASARETINAQLREAQSIKTTLMAEASEKAQAMVSNAQTEVAAERTRLLSELRLHVTDLALSAAERVVGENMDTERNRRIVDDFIASSTMPAPLPPTGANVATTPAGVSSQTTSAPTTSGEQTL